MNQNYIPFSEELDKSQLDKFFIDFQEINQTSNGECGIAPLGKQSKMSSVIKIACFVRIAMACSKLFCLSFTFIFKDSTTIERLLMTAMGFTSPLWKKDRNKYVTINWQNIDDKYKYLFHKWNFDFHNHQDVIHEVSGGVGVMNVMNTYDDEITKYLTSWQVYDYNSVLHYSPTQV